MNIKEIQGIIKDFENSTLTSLELEFDNVKIKLSKQPLLGANQLPQGPIIHHIEPVLPIDSPSHICVPVKSPLVGTFFASSTPKGDPFVKVGQTIKKGDTVCIIEAMKIMNEIVSPVSGIVERIDVLNGQVVGYDQVLITIHTGEGRGE